jgi:hypothetical protein
MRTARTLEVDSWQVLGEAWVRGQRKMSPVLGAFRLLDFTMLRPVLAWSVLKLTYRLFFNFQFFFSGRGNLRKLNQCILWHTCLLNYLCYSNVLRIDVPSCLHFAYKFTNQYNSAAYYSFLVLDIVYMRQSQWPRGLRRRSTAASVLRSWVRIPPGHGCLSVVCVVR